jgi:hypothetical protein
VAWWHLPLLALMLQVRAPGAAAMQKQGLQQLQT